MSMVKVEAAGQEVLDRAARLLAGIDGGIKNAVKSAMSRSTAYLRANSAKAVRERYAISAANIRANENVKVSYTYRDGVQAFVMFSGRKIPLYRYDGAAPAQPTRDTSRRVGVIIEGEKKWVHPSVAAQGRQLKSESPTRYHYAFTAQMESGHIGIFERNGRTTKTGGAAISEMMGSSVPQMLGSPDVEEKLGRDSMKKFEERLDHEILRILNGWGV